MARYWYFSSFVNEFTVYVVSCPRSLPEDAGIDEMADGYGRVLDEELGPADVLGVSMGGMITQSLAARHPEAVDRLVLSNSGPRVDDVETVDRFLGYSANRDWASIRAELSTAMFSDWRAAVYPSIAVTLGRVLASKPADPDDVRISLEAIREYDGTDLLGDIAAPTLVFGGTEDPFFPEAVLRETAAGIPETELTLVHGGKHGAFHEQKPAFDSRAAAFLDRQKSDTRRG